MRLMTLGVVALVMLAVGAVYMQFFAPRRAHIAELVPEDAVFCICYGSVEDLRELYEEGPFTRSDSDPAQLRIGDPINVPEFNGVSHTEEVAFYTVRNGDQLVEVALVPIIDKGAFQEAFDKNRENLDLRPPVRVAQNYVSLSRSAISAKHGQLNRRVAEAAKYPVALVGRPEDGRALRLMLTALLAREPSRFPQGTPSRLWEQVAKQLPLAVADVVARQCDDFLLGFAAWRDAGQSARADVRAAPHAGSLLARAPAVAKAVDLGEVLGSFPRQTLLLVGGVLDGAGWKELGLPLPLGDGVFAFGVVEKHPGDLTLLVAARPREALVLATLDDRVLVDDPAADLPGNTIRDGETVVKTARLEEPPAWMGDFLRSDRRKPPPVYLSSATEGGIWYAAVGRWAEAVVRDALACRRGGPELSVRGTTYLSADPGFFGPGHVAAGLVTPAGLERAFEHPMPLVEMASIGQPKAVTFVLDVDGEAKAEIRLPHK